MEEARKSRIDGEEEDHGNVAGVVGAAGVPNPQPSLHALRQAYPPQRRSGPCLNSVI